MPYHVLQDGYEEERLAGRAFGSTKSGIAPFYSDKYAKTGIQVCDLFDEERLRQRLNAAVERKNIMFQYLYHKPLLDAEALFDELIEYRELIRPYVGDAVTFVHQALKAGKTVLLEGQLGSMKDPDLGIFPMTTSSHTLAGFGTVGACVPPTAIEDVITVTKAYSSCVGSKTEPFVSELLGEEGGATQVALTCLDVLGYLDEIKVVTGYEIDGEITTTFPTPSRLERAKPVFTTLKGWKSDIRGITDYDVLPENAKAYVDFLEQQIEAPITIVSTGPKRHETTYRISKL